MERTTWDDQHRYRQVVKERAPKPKVARDLLRAFIVGAILSAIGQVFFDLFSTNEPTKGEATAATLAAMIALGAILTGFGVYDKIAEWGKAGAAVPITGFSNTVVAAAMDFKREGYVLGMGAKMFIIAGPVLVFGTLAGFFTGLIKASVLGLFKFH